MFRSHNPNNNEFYKLLNIDKNANYTQIKKAYYKAAAKHHPDKGGNEDLFKKINHAYETLSDPDKRKLYDQYGENGPPETFGHGFPFSFPFNVSGRNSRQRGNDIKFELSVTLNELYNGCVKKLKISKNVICNTCNGSGQRPNTSKNTCNICKGSGINRVIRKIGPMIQEIRSPCTKCGGEGSIIEDKDKCKTCKGRMLNNEIKILKIHIEKGMKGGNKIILYEESNQEINMITGDVIVILKEIKHKQFKRIDSDLYIKKTITLLESLTEYTFKIKHLDGRILMLHSPSEITKPHSIKLIKDEGMPKHKNPFNKGSLLVKFSIKFPAVIPKEYHPILKKMFKPRNNRKNKDNDNNLEIIDLKLENCDNYQTPDEVKESDEYSDGEEDEFMEVNNCPTQ